MRGNSGGRSSQNDTMKELFKNYQATVAKPLPSLRDFGTMRTTTGSRQSSERKSKVARVLQKNEYDALRTYLNERSTLLKQLKVVERQKLQLKSIKQTRLIQTSDELDSRRRSPRAMILSNIRAKNLK